MDGLDQVSDDSGCYEGPDYFRPAGPQTDLRRKDGSRLERWNRLARTIEGEVIPRLLLAHRAEPAPRAMAMEAASFGVATPSQFGRVVLSQPEDAALGFIFGLIDTGLPLESIYLDLLAPTARWLGERWTDDDISFTDVTIALTRLQRLMRTLGALADQSRQAAEERSQLILLAPMPADQHMFGVLMLEEFCRREGWNVECMPACSRMDLVEAVKRRRPAIVGLSVSVDERLDEMRILIDELRQSARDPGLVVMVGGRCFNEHPDYVDVVGADFTAVDGRDAIVHIQSHLSKRVNSGTEP